MIALNISVILSNLDCCVDHYLMESFKRFCQLEHDLCCSQWRLKIVSGWKMELRFFTIFDGAYRDKNSSINLLPLSGNEISSLTIVKCWYNELNRICRLLSSECREGRPKTVFVPENIDAIQKSIMQDRQVAYCQIEANLLISSTSIYKILQDHLAKQTLVLLVTFHVIRQNLKKMLKKYKVGVSKNLSKVFAFEPYWNKWFRKDWLLETMLLE